MRVVLVFSPLPSLVGPEVFLQLIDDVEAEEVADRRSDQLHGTVPRRVALDLLAIEEEQVGDVRRDKVLDLADPVLGQRVVAMPVLDHLEVLPVAAGAPAPRSMQPEAVFPAVDGVAKRELDGGPARIRAAMDAAGQVVPVGQSVPVGYLRERPVQTKLHGVQQGRLAVAVEPAEEDDRPAGVGWRQDDRLAFAVEPEIVQDELVEDHDATVAASSAGGRSNISRIRGSLLRDARSRASSTALWRDSARSVASSSLS